MNSTEVGTKLVAWFNEGKFEEIYSNLYSPDILSVEASGENREYKGMEAIQKKNEWWEATYETHSMVGTGPYPHGDDLFAVRYQIDVTEKASGNRFPMDEVGVYKVANGKIVEERFFYGE